jgi:hypothetical protein
MMMNVVGMKAKECLSCELFTELLLVVVTD